MDTALSETFYSLHTAVGNGAMSKYRIDINEKIPALWKYSGRGNGKTAGKNSGMVGISLRERLRLPVHENFSTAISVVKAEIYLPFLYQCNGAINILSPECCFS